MDVQNFIAEFKKTFIYDLLSQTLTDEQLFEHAIDGDGVTWFKEQMRQMWDLWQAAKAQAAPEGFVVVPIAPILKILDAASSLAPIKTMIEAQEPADD